MIGNSAGITGTQVGTEGFFTGMDRITGKKERDTQDGHFPNRSITGSFFRKQPIP
jgi:hypothetical protein